MCSANWYEGVLSRAPTKCTWCPTATINCQQLPCVCSSIDTITHTHIITWGSDALAFVMIQSHTLWSGVYFVFYWGVIYCVWYTRCNSFDTILLTIRFSLLIFRHFAPLCAIMARSVPVILTDFSTGVPVVILVILGIRRSIQSQSVPVVLIFPIPLPHFSILPQCITKDRAVCHSACLSTVDCPSTKCSTMVVAWVIFIPVCSDISIADANAALLLPIGWTFNYAAVQES